ncbi:hypothetical protein ACIODS_12090 [Micromonospora chalcea]|uniref:hypothetical protein n=1 Tax=Micromonospora chalcea TaxID=1874 RepID=UPI003808FE83
MTADLTNLAHQLHTAANLPDPDRYQAIRHLNTQLKAALATEQDAIVARLCDTHTREHVAEQLGISTGEVNRRMTAHRKRIGAEPRRGRKPANPT